MKRILLAFFIYLIIIPKIQAFGQNKIQADNINWSKIRTMHFDIYFVEGEDDFGKTLALMAEEGYYYLKESFRIPLKDKIPLIVYKNHLEFEKTNIIYPILNEAVGGFTESMKNRVVVPFDGSYVRFEETLVHELTHAYVNGLTLDSMTSKMLNIGGGRFPFWFQEGLPEYLSMRGTSVNNEMYIQDMVMNNDIQPLNQVDGYLAYRQGESFITYLSEIYGHEKVAKLFYTMRLNANQDASFEKVFGLKFDDIEKRWINYLKRKHASKIIDYEIPYEKYTQLTNHEKDASGINIQPKISPDGQYYLYFSDKHLRMGIWTGSTLMIIPQEQEIKGETTGKYEDFHIFRMGISWFPDSKHFAFVVKNSFNDVIFVRNIETGKNIREIIIPELEAIFEIDISHDGKRIVLSGQKGTQTDIYIYDIDSETLINVTNDRYFDFEPKWSPDDSKIAFSSERNSDLNERRPFVFSALRNNIYYSELLTQNIYQVTGDTYNNTYPIWDKTGENILFLSERTGVTNFDIVNIKNGKRAVVTKLLSGINSGDISVNNESMLLSCYFGGGWDIYQAFNIIDSLYFQDYGLPQILNIADDFYERFHLENYKLYGEKEKKKSKERNDYKKEIQGDPEVTRAALVDSLFSDRREDPDTKPEQISIIPEIKKYKPEFYLDYFWGGLAYSSSAGMIGQLYLSFSDLLGNHNVNVSTGLAGSFKNTDFNISYYYLKNRIDYGLGAFKLSDDTVYRIIPINDPDEYYYMRIREYYYGGQILTSYPINRYWRTDLSALVYKYEKEYDKSEWNYNEGDWSDWEETGERKESFLYAPQLSLIHDNALYGSTGPISGWRGFVTYTEGISTRDNSFRTIYTDLRMYNFFAKRFCFATRLLGAASFGDDPQQFDLEGFSGVRGYDSDDRDEAVEDGSRKALVSAELRYPFVDYLKLGFPLPITMGNIRGSMFADIGSVWTDQFRGTQDGKLKDLRMSYGFGPRLNIGYFVLRLDISWTTDLSKNSKPTYYFSLWPDF